MSVKLLHVVLYTLCLVLVMGSVVAINKPKVKVGKWNISGVSLGRSSVHAYLGIPYAKPPVAELRWEEPVAIDFDETAKKFSANSISPHCPQKCRLKDQSKCWKTSEDCLYLNVYVPANIKPSKRIPVMVFLHGGSFARTRGAFGSTSRHFDGREIAAQGSVIVVIPNYRVGALGFLYSGSNSEDAHGNYGLLDQRAALQWVQKYIGKFGGDPDKVTAVGQSAGAESVVLHMADDLSSRLFHQAVLMSPPMCIPMYSPERHLKICKGLGNQPNIACSGCNISCLREKSADDLAIASDLPPTFFDPTNPIENIHNFQHWSPLIDGELVKYKSLMKHFTQSKNDMSVLIGNVKDESIVFFPIPIPLPDTVYSGVLSTVIVPSRAELLKIFPPLSNETDQSEYFYQVINDVAFRCPARSVSRQVADSRSVFMYHFTHKPTFDFAAGNTPRCNGRPCHSSDLVFWYHENRVEDGYAFTKEEAELSRRMIQYLSNFYEFGTPNNPHDDVTDSVPFWPRYRSEEWESLNLGTTLLDDDKRNDVFKKYQTAACDAVDAVGYRFE